MRKKVYIHIYKMRNKIEVQRCFDIYYYWVFIQVPFSREISTWIVKFAFEGKIFYERSFSTPKPVGDCSFSKQFNKRSTKVVALSTKKREQRRYERKWIKRERERERESARAEKPKIQALLLLLLWIDKMDLRDSRFSTCKLINV